MVNNSNQVRSAAYSYLYSRSTKGGVITRIIPHATISVLVADSGIGKSPLAYQMALSVASGSRFSRQTRIPLITTSPVPRYQAVGVRIWIRPTAAKLDTKGGRS